MEKIPGVPGIPENEDWIEFHGRLLWGETGNLYNDPLGRTMAGEGKERGAVSLCSSLFSLSTLPLPPDPIFIIIRSMCRRKNRQRKKRKGGKGWGTWIENSRILWLTWRHQCSSLTDSSAQMSSWWFEWGAPHSLGYSSWSLQLAAQFGLV